MNQTEGHLSITECKLEQLEFRALTRRAVVDKFDGGMVRSDGGGVVISRDVATSAILSRQLGE
jgi:hypothetical protein